MVFYHAELPIAKSEREHALELLDELVDRSRQEPGVIEYHAAIDVRDPTTIRLIEEFEDQAAYQHHEATDHVTEFEAELPELLAGDLRIVQLSVAEKSTRME